MIRLAMVEDDFRFRASVAAALELVADVTLVALATTRGEGLALLQGPAADVLLVDLGLPDGNGLDVILAAQKAWPDCAVMVATLFGDEDRVLACLAAGASGYLLKDAIGSGIVDEIRTLHGGGSPINPLIARRLLAHFRPPAPASEAEPRDDGLSMRERQVLTLITRGYAAGEIAGELAVSPWTVQTYVRRIYTKLGVSGRAAAIGAAHRLGLADAEGG